MSSKRQPKNEQKKFNKDRCEAFLSPDKVSKPSKREKKKRQKFNEFVAVGRLVAWPTLISPGLALNWKIMLSLDSNNNNCIDFSLIILTNTHISCGKQSQRIDNSHYRELCKRPDWRYYSANQNGKVQMRTARNNMKKKMNKLIWIVNTQHNGIIPNIVIITIRLRKMDKYISFDKSKKLGHSDKHRVHENVFNKTRANGSSKRKQFDVLLN